MPRLGRRPTVRGMSSSHTSPPIRRILTLPLRNLHYSPNSLAEPAKGKLCVQPTFVSFSLLSWELPGCFDCLREGRTIRGEGDDQRRGATLDPCCFAPWSIGTLPPQLITPGKPPPFPGELDHFARPNGRHSLWVFKAQLLTVPGGEPPGGRTQRGRGGHPPG